MREIENTTFPVLNQNIIPGLAPLTCGLGLCPNSLISYAPPQVVQEQET